MIVDLALRLRPTPDEIFALDADTGPDYYRRVIQQPFRGISLEVLSTYAYDDISKRTGEIQDQILQEIQKALSKRHLDFSSVEIRHVEYPERVIEATNEKLATQEMAEQKEYEKTIAEADAQIKIIDARGQQEAQEIIESTLTPLYLQFQAIEVQRQLAQSPNAVFYFVPLGQDGLPFLVETPLPEAVRSGSAATRQNTPEKGDRFGGARPAPASGEYR